MNNEAVERIRKEKQLRTGRLNLSGLHLTEIPVELLVMFCVLDFDQKVHR